MQTTHTSWNQPQHCRNSLQLSTPPSETSCTEIRSKVGYCCCSRCCRHRRKPWAAAASDGGPVCSQQGRLVAIYCRDLGRPTIGSQQVGTWATGVQCRKHLWEEIPRAHRTTLQTGGSLPNCRHINKFARMRGARPSTIGQETRNVARKTIKKLK